MSLIHSSDRTATDRVHLRTHKRPSVSIFGVLLVVVAVIAAPTWVAEPAHAAAGSKLYVGLFKEDAVAVVEIATGTVLSKISVPSGPHGLVVTPDGRKVYVSSDGATSVTAIDTATDSVTRTIEVGKAPHGLTLTPDGKLLLIGVWEDNQLAFLDTTTDEVVRQTPVVAPHNMAESPDGKDAFVGSQAPDAPLLAHVNVQTGDIVSKIMLDGVPRGLSVSPDGRWLYVTRAGADDVLVIDLATEQPANKIAVGPSPHFPLFTPNGTAIVNGQGLGQLLKIDVASQTVTGTATVGQRPHWTALSADGKVAYETNEGSNDVSVVDLSTMTVLATIPVGEAPRKLALLPGAEAVAPRAGSTVGAMVSGGAPPAPGVAASAAPATGTVESRIVGFKFGAPITVDAGQTVTWTNDDSVAHTVTDEGRTWRSGELAPGQHFSKQFDTPGQYAYLCELHPFMRGQVIVR